MEEKERVQRVEEMERAMDALAAAAEKLELALEDWAAARTELQTLAAYYESPLWREDFEADEAGKLPAELRRGVLSEDGLYDLLERAEALERRLQPADEGE